MKPFMKLARAKLGLTQKALAGALRVSLKAVQSYEQGWRRPPDSVVLHLVSLLALRTGSHGPARPCWRITRCPAKIRNACPAYLVSRGKFCWLMGGTSCAGESAARCLSCGVVRRLVA